ASNPPQAQHLVERIARMLRRSVLGWDGESTSSQPVLSRALAAPQLTDKIVAGGAEPGTIEPPPRARTKLPWAIGVFAFGAIGAALAVVAMTRHESPGPLPQTFLDRARPPVVWERPAPPPSPAPTVVETPPVVTETPLPAPAVVE